MSVSNLTITKKNAEASRGIGSGGSRPLGGSDLGWRSITGLDGSRWRIYCPCSKERGRLEGPLSRFSVGGLNVPAWKDSGAGSCAVVKKQSIISGSLVRVH
jgi:hypothetical protein